MNSKPAWYGSMRRFSTTTQVLRGRKQSGMGRQLGSEGLDTFRHTKLSMIDHAAKAHDFWWFPYADAEAFPGDRNG